MVQISPVQDFSFPSKGFSQYILGIGFFNKLCSVFLEVTLAVTQALSQPSVCSWGTETSHGWRECWNFTLSYGQRLANSWLYLDLKINLVCVPLHFGLLENDFYLFFKNVCMCHSFAFSPFICSSWFFQTWSHSTVCDVSVFPYWQTVLSETRSWCLFQMREKGNTDGRKKIRGVRGEQQETHTTELQGKMQSPNPTFPAEGKGLLSLDSGRSSKMNV